MNIISVTTNIDYPVFVSDPSRNTENSSVDKERAVKDIKQPSATTNPSKKSDPSNESFTDEEE